MKAFHAQCDTPTEQRLGDTMYRHSARCTFRRLTPKPCLKFHDPPTSVDQKKNFAILSEKELFLSILVMLPL